MSFQVVKQNFNVCTRCGQELRYVDLGCGPGAWAIRRPEIHVEILDTICPDGGFHQVQTLRLDDITSGLQLIIEDLGA